MSVASDPHAREIIIVRHHGGDHDDGHHGGAWKIAFADFMTAMMCFFLVMWLINAANEETKVAVASYFNPVKLVDRNSAKRGLDSLGEGPQAADSPTQTSVEETKKQSKEGPQAGAPATSSTVSEAPEARKFTDQHLFEDPYAVLAEIAGDTGKQQNVSARGEGGAADAGPASGASGGEAYRDPFAPDFWSQEVLSPPASEAAPETAVKADAAAAAKAAAAETAAGPLAEPAPPPAEAVPAQAAASAEAPLPAAAPVPAAKPAISDAMVKEAARIDAMIREAMGQDDRIAGAITVVPVEQGVLISLTDRLDGGMFEIGSAVPSRELVLAMEKIAGVLKSEKGNIVINGHTDGRPFASPVYDNWRLSTARAQSAYYMLARAGLDEKRIVEIAGYADRRLKVPDDPMSEKNRRIEILLEAGP